MAESPTEELSSSWCFVDRNGKNIDQVEDTVTEESTSTILAPSEQKTSEDGVQPDTSGNNLDRASLVPTPDISMESEDASSDHSDFEVFEKDIEGEEEKMKQNEMGEEEEESASDAGASARTEKKDSISSSSVSHEQRIRLALNNLRGGDGQPQMPTPLESPQVEDSSRNEGNPQVAEPPRVQIIRLNADEESLPESDIQLEEAQGAAPGLFVQEQYDMMLDGDRVRRYQHLPNPNLNARLNNLALGALLFVIGLAVGHFIGSTHERFSQHFQRVDCLDRVKNVQNELLRCARKYDEMELQLNEVKATLVQKEYVDKWESLYQEGEEEKATLTATMNLYKNRYLKQQQQLDERLNRMKSMQNELLRCTHKYEQLELKQNEQKATLVQKEYVDKWESLYQEGEEEKAALTATMNLYKSRYNKQKQLLTQCEVHYQDLQEQFNKIKMGKTNIYANGNPEPEIHFQVDCGKCERQKEAVTLRLRDLEGQLSNCTQYKRDLNMTDQLLLFLHPLLSLDRNTTLHAMNFTFLKNTTRHISNSTKLILAKLQQKFNLTSNMTRLVGDWLNATFLSGNNSDKFAEWLSGVSNSVNTTDLYVTLSKASVAVADKVEKTFDILSAAIKNLTGKAEKTENQESLFQQMKAKLKIFGDPLITRSETSGESVDENKEKLGLHTLSTAWRMTLQSTRDVWEASVRKAKGVLKELKEPVGNPSSEPSSPKPLTEPAEATGNDEVSFSKRKLSSLNKPDQEGKVTPTKETRAAEENLVKTVSKEEDRADVTKTEDAPITHATTKLKEPPTDQRSQDKVADGKWFEKRAEARRSYHDTGSSSDWYWKSKNTDRDSKTERLKDDKDENDDWLKEHNKQLEDLEMQAWPDTFWYTRRRMGRAEQRVKKILRFLSDRLALYKWMDKRKKLRANARKRRKKFRPRQKHERQKYSRKASKIVEDDEEEEEEDRD